MSVRRSIAIAGAIATTSAVYGQAPTPPSSLGDLGLEELMNVKVTTASKEAQSLSKVPAAVYVVTSEQIRRSGATTIPEALRMVPGVQVQQLSPSQWSVSIRGMGGRFSNKLLVLMDGRTVYSPTFSGVYWDAQDIDLSLVDRIEVIRGPGGTLWGTNAVNGIINIISKSAKATQGDRVTLDSSTASPYSVDFAHGAAFANGAYRINARGFKQNSLDSTLGNSAGDAWDGLRAGLRVDWTHRADSFSLSADGSSSHQGSTDQFPTLSAPYSFVEQERYTTSEFDFVGKWERTEGVDKGMSLQVSFDHYDRDMPEAGDRRTTGSVDFQKPLSISRDNHLIWGLGYNTTSAHELPGQYITFSSNTSSSSLFSGFIQDEATLGSKTQLSIGTKLEHNDFTGWEYQPSARIDYAPTEDKTWWAAVSRAVRIPSIGETDTSTYLAAEPGPGGVPVQLRLVGNPYYDAEDVLATELGWRYAPSNRWFLDVASFYNHYTGLRGATALAPTVVASSTPYVLQPLQQGNDYAATTAGVELAGHVMIRPQWSLDTSYTFYTESYNLTTSGGSALGSGSAGKGLAPSHQFSIRSQVDLPRGFEFDLTGYYVGALQTSPEIAAYARLDLRLGWKPSRSTEYSIGVTNLMNDSHVEGVSTPFALSAQIRRNIYAKISLAF